MPSGLFVYDYYDIDVPSDLGDEEERLDCAINEARERTKLYVMPCSWTARLLDDSGYDCIYRVTRKRYRKERSK